MKVRNPQETITMVANWKKFHQQQNTFNEEPGFKTEKHL